MIGVSNREDGQWMGRLCSSDGRFWFCVSIEYGYGEFGGSVIIFGENDWEAT